MRSAIRRVNEHAFGRPGRGGPRGGGASRSRARTDLIGRGARREVVGHCLFSPVTFDAERDGHTIAGLGPMAVAPAVQRRGIGTLLVRHGLAAGRDAGIAGVVALGHPAYYPRFGFVPASRFGIRCTFAVPDEVFMAIELEAGAYATAAASRGTRPSSTRSDGRRPCGPMSRTRPSRLLVHHVPEPRVEGRLVRRRRRGRERRHVPRAPYDHVPRHARFREGRRRPHVPRAPRRAPGRL